MKMKRFRQVEILLCFKSKLSVKWLCYEFNYSHINVTLRFFLFTDGMKVTKNNTEIFSERIGFALNHGIVREVGCSLYWSGIKSNILHSIFKRRKKKCKIDKITIGNADLFTDRQEIDLFKDILLLWNLFSGATQK